MTHDKLITDVKPTNGNRITLGPWWGQLVRSLVSIAIVAMVSMLFASMIRQQRQDDRLDNLEYRLGSLESTLNDRLTNLEDKSTTTTQLLYETRMQNLLVLKQQGQLKLSMSDIDSSLVEHDRKVMSRNKGAK